MARSQKALSQWQQLADCGDPDAQIVMAWNYANGKIVAKDFDRAVALFRAAEPAKGPLARFNLAKAMILNSDQSYDTVLRSDCDAGFGPALYLMGVVEERGIFHERNLDKALQYFSRAARNNHLIAEVFAWRLQRKSIWGWITTLPYGLRLTIKTIVLYAREPNDLRVLS